MVDEFVGEAPVERQPADEQAEVERSVELVEQNLLVEAGSKFASGDAAPDYDARLVAAPVHIAVGEGVTQFRVVLGFEDDADQGVPDTRPG